MDWLTLLVGVAVALAASAALVTALERLGARFSLSEASLGLLVALAADSPEVSAAVAAYVRHEPGIGVGVVLGSNAFNLAALLGLGAVVAGRIALHRKVVLLEGVVAASVAVLTVGTVAAPEHCGRLPGAHGRHPDPVRLVVGPLPRAPSDHAAAEEVEAVAGDCGG